MAIDDYASLATNFGLLGLAYRNFVDRECEYIFGIYKSEPIKCSIWLTFEGLWFQGKPRHLNEVTRNHSISTHPLNVFVLFLAATLKCFW